MEKNQDSSSLLPPLPESPTPLGSMAKRSQRVATRPIVLVSPRRPGKKRKANVKEDYSTQSFLKGTQRSLRGLEEEAIYILEEIYSKPLRSKDKS